MFLLHSSATHRDLHSFPTRRSSDLNEKSPEPASMTTAGLPRPACWTCRRHPPTSTSLPGGGGSEEPSRVAPLADRKSTRLNSSHLGISYAVFCLKKKNNKIETKNNE